MPFAPSVANQLHGLPVKLRGLLHRAEYLVADPGDAARQTGRRKECATAGRHALRNLWKTGRPVVCASLRPTDAMCGSNREEVLAELTSLEVVTRPM